VQSSSDPSNVSFFEAYLCLLNNLNEKQNPCSHLSFFKSLPETHRSGFSKPIFHRQRKDRPEFVSN